MKVRREVEIIVAKGGVPTVIKFQGEYYALVPPNQKKVYEK